MDELSKDSVAVFADFFPKNKETNNIDAAKNNPDICHL
jgi:hypothetical protein